MKKTVLSISLIFFFGVYAFYEGEKAQAAVDVIIPDKFQIAFVPSATKQTGTYRDGRFLGNRADAYYGKVQVAVEILGGRIANVQVLEYPKAQQNSVRLNGDATPRLASEAIAVQSANVDAITGASLTSVAFIESLSLALSQASFNKLQ